MNQISLSSRIKNRIIIPSIRKFRVWRISAGNLICFSVFIISFSIFSEQDRRDIASYPIKELDFRTYLEEVLNNNYELASKKYNVNIAETEIEIAKKIPNPNLVM
ncbi:MAG TPA: hypothetical protein PL163_25000, partial [Leptospiraceae bacterium]|nr:hypothetical protein [Leptospiraceae bacterium]